MQHGLEGWPAYKCDSPHINVLLFSPENVNSTKTDHTNNKVIFIYSNNRVSLLTYARTNKNSNYSFGTKCKYNRGSGAGLKLTTGQWPR